MRLHGDIGCVKVGDAAKTSCSHGGLRIVQAIADGCTHSHGLLVPQMHAENWMSRPLAFNALDIAT